MEEEKHRHLGLVFWLVTLLLCMVAGFLVLDQVHKASLERTHLQERIAALETRSANTANRITFLESLQSLSPCDAKKQWTTP